METFKGECTYKEIKRVASLSKKLNVDMIFGVGGGKALDTAKGAAHEANIPIITLPTIAATCAAITALSVVYNEDGSFDSFYFFPKPPFHCLIDTQIIAEAPVKYLRAGMGDTLGKHYEALLSSRGDELSHSSLLGVTISNMCGAPILKYGKEALEECEKDLAGKALEYAVLSNIVSTGLVSILVEECYNCAVAHSLFYALEILPHFNEHHLHGDERRTDAVRWRSLRWGVDGDAERDAIYRGAGQRLYPRGLPHHQLQLRRREARTGAQDL